MLNYIGAGLIIAACGTVGFSMAVNHRKEESALRRLIAALAYMESELEYTLPQLPILVHHTGEKSSGEIAKVFLDLSRELESQISPDVSRCMAAVLARHSGLPQVTKGFFEELGHSLGCFDLQGQLKGLSAVRNGCLRCMESLENNRDVRLRSYQTLGLCAGAALAVLLI